MARFSGLIGFIQDSVETGPGIWENRVVEKHYNGTFLAESQKWQSAEKLSDDIVLSMRISIVNTGGGIQFDTIRYVKFQGAYWCVTKIELQHPRVILTIGGLYNGPTA